MKKSIILIAITTAVLLSMTGSALARGYGRTRTSTSRSNYNRQRHEYCISQGIDCDVRGCSSCYNYNGNYGGGCCR